MSEFKRLLCCSSLQHYTTHCQSVCKQVRCNHRITLNGGSCCQMKNMNFPRAGEMHRRCAQKHTSRQTALQDGPVGCTLRRAGGLHSKLGCGKGRAGGLPFSAARPALFRSPRNRLFVKHAPLSSVQPADSSRFSFGNTALQPAQLRWARTGLDQNWSQFWPGQDWIGLQFFHYWRIRTGSDRENFCCFNVVILKISKNLVMIRFHRFAKWKCIFYHQMQKPSWDYFTIRIVSSIVHI